MSELYQKDLHQNFVRDQRMIGEYERDERKNLGNLFEMINNVDRLSCVSQSS